MTSYLSHSAMSPSPWNLFLVISVVERISFLEAAIEVGVYRKTVSEASNDLGE